MCLWDSEAIRLQTSRWKRSLLIFSSGVCLELAAIPLALNWFGFEVRRSPLATDGGLFAARARGILCKLVRR